MVEGLSPPGLPPAGLDLPIAVAILTAAGAIRQAWWCRACSSVALVSTAPSTPVPGVLPAATAAVADDAEVALVAPGAAAGAALVPGLPVVRARRCVP